MGDGKREVLPCGHTGEYIIGRYAQCPFGCSHESDGVPEIDLEIPDTKPLCRHCGSEHVAPYTGFAFASSVGQVLYHCHNCGKAFWS